MSLRKHWGKLTLGIAASFWAGCNDTGTEAEFKGEPISCGEQEECGSNTVIALYGVPVYDVSSSSIAGDCESSSSAEIEYPYVLYSDPNVHCKDTTQTIQMTNEVKCPTAKTDSNSINEVMPVYGVVYPTCNEGSFVTSVTVSYYKCDNGEMLNTSDYKEKDGVVYTNKEYEQLFGKENSADQQEQ